MDDDATRVARMEGETPGVGAYQRMRKKAFSSEYEMVKIVVRFLRDNGYTVETEIPFYSSSIDIVGEKNGKVLAIEAKLGNWKRGLEQCRNHHLVADYVSVVMGSVSISERLVALARAQGFGVFHCSPRDGVIREVVEPKQSFAIWKSAQDHFVKNFRAIVQDPTCFMKDR